MRSFLRENWWPFDGHMGTLCLLGADVQRKSVEDAMVVTMRVQAIQQKMEEMKHKRQDKSEVQQNTVKGMIQHRNPAETYAMSMTHLTNDLFLAG